MKIVINNCFGGFNLSSEQVQSLGLVSAYDAIERTNPALIESVERGDTGGQFADLGVVEIPDGSHFEIIEYDGSEYVIYSATPLVAVYE